MNARTTRPLRSAVAILALGFTPMATATVSGQQPAGGDGSEAVRAAVRAHWQAINRGDTETILAQHLPDGTAFLTEWGARIGLDPHAFAPLLAMFEGSVPDWHPRDIQVRTFGEVAVASFYLDGSVRRADGTVDAGPRRVTEVWVRTSDGWKEAHHHDDPVPPEGARSDVERASDVWWEALLRSDLEASMRAWTDDAVAHPPGAVSMSGLAELREGLRAQFETIRLQDLRMTSREIEVMGGIAYEVATYDVTVVPVAGGGPGERVEGRYTVIWRRGADGSWKAARDIWNFGPAAGRSRPSRERP
jgi:ketosteroid isomerase-like protein